MISCLNLLWIIPLSVLGGLFLGALMSAASDRDDWRKE